MNVIEKIDQLLEESNSTEKPYFILDGTHYVPHRRTDLNSFKSADAIICSAYKFFGPHIGVMAFKGHRFSKLKPNKVGYRFQPNYQDILDCGPFPNEENCEISRWEMGTLNYEGLAGFEACVDYLASLSKPPKLTTDYSSSRQGTRHRAWI